jgi:methionine sulfoxide reductase heme-binding subunit
VIRGTAVWPASWSDVAHGPALWYANRATGVVLVGLLTLATGIGVLSTARAGSPRWPRFATQVLHRNVSLLAMAMLLAHVASAVIDSYVDIRWYDAVLPFAGRYRRIWLGTGAVSFDVLAVVVVTSLARGRLPHRTWRVLHLAAYLAWAVGVVHGMGIGTDASSRWGMSVNAVSVGVVAAFCVVRLGTLVHERRLRV